MTNRSLAAIALLILAAAALWFGLPRKHEAAPISGTIEVDEVHVASRYGGRVEKINVREGDALRAGQVIVELEADELKARREFAVAQLAELEQGPRAAEIEAARQDWEAQKAQLEFARADARRAQELLAQKSVSLTEGERAVSTARAMEKSVEAARQRYELLQQGTRPERVAQSRAQLAEIDAQLREMQIAAPSDCVVELLSVKVGDVLGPNRELATLILPQHLWVRVYVPESWLGNIAVNDEVRLRVDSFRDEKFSGEVEQINRSAEFTPRNVQTVEDRIKQVFGVKIRLANPNGKLRAGMSADVSFPRLSP